MLGKDLRVVFNVLEYTTSFLATHSARLLGVPGAKLWTLHSFVGPLGRTLIIPSHLSLLFLLRVYHILWHYTAILGSFYIRSGESKIKRQNSNIGNPT